MLLPAATASPITMMACPYRAASASRPFEDSDLVRGRDQRCVGEPCGASTDHRDAFAHRRVSLCELPLAAGSGVDDTAQLRPRAHLVDAGVTGKAPPCRL